MLLCLRSSDFSNDDTNQLREQCRCATCTSFWPWALHDCKSRSRNTSILWIIFSWRVLVCVRFSSETTWPISPMMIPINRGNNVDVQHAQHFILTLTPPWLQVKVTKYFNFVNYFSWWVLDLVCVRFSSEATRPISPMMIPMNWGNCVDVQRALHFDLHPSMTAGQGHKILWFWEFRCLTGCSLCSLLLRFYSTDFSNDDSNQLGEQCRSATCTSFWPSPLHVQVKVTKYFNFVNLGCCLGMNAIYVGAI